MIGYDPERVRVLHRLAGRAVDALDAVRSDDPAAAPAMAAVRIVRSEIDDACSRLAERVLLSDAMLTFHALGLVPVVGRLLAGHGSDHPTSTTDTVLIQLLHHFALLDVDGDGELTGEELALGLAHAAAEVRDVCRYLLDRPLTVLNVAMAGSRWAVHEGSDDVDLRAISISPTAISHALAQNQVLRLLADPAWASCWRTKPTPRCAASSS
jgi:hypothetical protein